MKGSELMIGDIVAVNNTPLQIAALGTARAGFLDARGEMFYHYYDNMAPIPLTAEILRKSGFAQHHSYEDGITFEKFVTDGMRIDQLAKDLFVWICPGTDTGILTLHNVHELQHALRLCGIDKQIEL
jgi:hypothetical protein